MFTNIDTLFTYSNDVAALTAEEEAHLITEAQTGNEAATLALLTAYGPVLRSSTSNFLGRLEQPTKDDIEETRMEAVTAVIGLIQSHDPAKNPRLAGRVVSTLHGAFGEMARLDSAVSVPRRSLDRFYEVLREAEGDIETAMNLAPQHDLSKVNFLAILRAVRYSESLEARQEADEARSEATGPTADEKPIWSNRDRFSEVEDTMLIEAAFAAVDDREARIVELAYGFTEHDPVPDAEIAHRIGGTRPTIQRQRGKALDKMRKALGVTLAESK